MSVMTELFANPPASATIVSSGGTTAPAAGSSESWTVSSSTGWPAASNSTVPASMFRIFDPAQPTEIMVVTNVSGTTWTVTRGAEGTPVAHASGFTVENVITGASMNSMVQGPPSDYGMNLPAAGVVTGAPVSNTTVAQTIAQITVPANEPVAGSVYEIELFGIYSTTGTPSLVFTVQWGATTTGSQAVGTGSGAANARWRVHAIIVFTSPTAYTINVKVDVATTNTGATSVPSFMFGPTASNTVTVSPAQVLKMTLAWGTASASNSFTLYGGKIWKSA
jgi:hypothetical protein